MSKSWQTGIKKTAVDELAVDEPHSWLNVVAPSSESIFIYLWSLIFESASRLSSYVPTKISRVDAPPSKVRRAKKEDLLGDIDDISDDDDDADDEAKKKSGSGDADLVSFLSFIEYNCAISS